MKDVIKVMSIKGVDREMEKTKNRGGWDQLMPFAQIPIRTRVIRYPRPRSKVAIPKVSTYLSILVFFEIEMQIHTTITVYIYIYYAISHKLTICCMLCMDYTLYTIPDVYHDSDRYRYRIMDKRLLLLHNIAWIRSSSKLTCWLLMHSIIPYSWAVSLSTTCLL